LCGNSAGFGDSAGIVRDEKPRLDGVGGIPDDTAETAGRCCMTTETPELKHRLESIKADALRFVEDMIECDSHTPRAIGVWRDIDEHDRARSEELRHRLRVFTLDLALAMESSPVLTKTDLRDIGRVGKRMCAALRFEKYTGSMIDRGDPIGVHDARYVLREGFEAMVEWVDLVPDPIPNVGARPSD
jgi:hypothetical protein